MPSNNSRNKVGFLSKLKGERVQIIAVFGSVCSIIALGVVLLDKIALHEVFSPQIAGWRIIFILICFFCLGCIVLFTYYFAKGAYYDFSVSPATRVFHVGWRVVAGALLFGVFLDGLFAALYWTPWLNSLPKLFHELWNSFIN